MQRVFQMACHQFLSGAHSCSTLSDPMDCLASMPGIAITFIAPQIFRSFLRIIAVKMITSYIYIYIYIYIFFFFFWTFVLEYSRLAGEGNGHPLQYSCWEIPRTEKLQSIGWLRVRQDWATEHSNSSWLAVLWQFQVSEGTQPYMCRYPFTPTSPSHPGCHITWSRVPRAVQ